MSTLEDDDIFEIASTFPNPVVQQYAGSLQEAGATRASFDRPTITEELIRAGIPAIPAGDIVDAFRKHFVRGPVGVYWDIENVGLPQDVTALAAVTALRERIMSNFGDILEFKAYIDLELYTSKYDSFTRVALGDSGLQIVDATHGGVEMKRKEVADKLIIVDALWFALTHENPTVCIISGDSDFSPLLAKLRMRGIRTIVVTASQNVRSLREQAKFALRWPEDFLPSASPVEGAPQRNRGAFDHSSTRAGIALSKAVPTREDPIRGVAESTPVLSPRLMVSSTPSGRSHQIVQARSSAAREPREKFADLLECIRRTQTETGANTVRRSKVGQYLKELNPLVNFRSIVQDAEQAGLVFTGGVLGNAWITLGKHHRANGGGASQQPNAVLEQSVARISSDEVEVSREGVQSNHQPVIEETESEAVPTPMTLPQSVESFHTATSLAAQPATSSTASAKGPTRQTGETAARTPPPSPAPRAHDALVSRPMPPRRYRRRMFYGTRAPPPSLP